MMPITGGVPHNFIAFHLSLIAGVASATLKNSFIDYFSLCYIPTRQISCVAASYKFTGAGVDLPKLSPIDPHSTESFSVPVNWGISDMPKFSALMAQLLPLLNAGYHLGDNLLTWQRNNSAIEDQVFVAAWNENVENQNDMAIVWRRYILACAGYHCVQLDGDFVECGVYLGSGIKTVMDYLGGKEFPKRFYGYDTFDYNPVAGHAAAGQTEGLYDKVAQRFEGYNQVVLVKGLLPESFSAHCPTKIAYLHIDLNNAEFEISVLEHLFEKVVPGGIVILDDYEWSGPYRAQKIAEDKWFEERRYRVFPLPTGQGLVLKR
jgi:O-methyltransferase